MWRVASAMLVGGLLLAAGARADEPVTTLTPAPSPDPHLHAEPWRPPPTRARRTLRPREIASAFTEVITACSAPAVPGWATLEAHADGSLRAWFDAAVPGAVRSCIDGYVSGWSFTGGAEVSVRVMLARPARLP